MRVHHDLSGHGEPLVLVSGLAQVGERWRRVVPFLADRYSVVTVDNRETGRTGPSPADFTLTDLAGDVLDVMDGLGHDRFFLAGQSMGGMIAQEVIRLAPARVRAAVLLASHGGVSAIVEHPDASVLVPTSADPFESARDMWARLSGPGFADAHPDVIEEEARLSADRPTPLEGIMRQLTAIFSFDPGDALVGTPVPIVVGHGDHDPLIPHPNGVRLSEKLGVRLVTFAGAGHGVEIERPAEVADLLRSHFVACASVAS